MKHEIPDCQHCDYRRPVPTANNRQFLSIWYLFSNCFHYAGNMECVFRTGLNWQDVKAIADIEHIKLSSYLVSRLRLCERLSLEQDAKRIKNGSKQR